MKKLVILFALIFCADMHAAQVATAIKSQTIIYADINLKNPIGFVRSGKKILVGEVKRNRESVLPVIIFGKVAFVKVEDIAIEGKKWEGANRRITEHDINEIYNLEDDDPWTENNDLLFKGSLFEPDEESLNALRNSRNSSENVMDFTLMWEHRNPYRWLHWGIGFEYYNITGEASTETARSVTYETLALRGELTLPVLKLGILSLEVMTALKLSADFRVKVEELGETQGQLVGGEAGFQGRLFPYWKIGFLGGIAYTRNVISGVKEVGSISGEGEVDVNSLNGWKLYAGIHYRF